MYSQTFLRSRLQIQSGIGIANGSIINHLNSCSCGDPINLYLLPDLNSDGMNIHLLELELRINVYRLFVFQKKLILSTDIRDFVICWKNSRRMCSVYLKILLHMLLYRKKTGYLIS